MSDYPKDPQKSCSDNQSSTLSFLTLYRLHCHGAGLQYYETNRTKREESATHHHSCTNRSSSPWECRSRRSLSDRRGHMTGRIKCWMLTAGAPTLAFFVVQQKWDRVDGHYQRPSSGPGKPLKTIIG
ncbi:hypothetical protein T10_11166 [Trichinella papuae]|uniref:Uncharacterized protein n=1 Tax=Trichinella papuae TaxID=268474 RepID=A0A0V1N9R2_9BILA|nr:hypothetical protein T10_11166 [Trichinella papuae]